MSCTRLYVESIDALMVQARKSILLSRIWWGIPLMCFLLLGLRRSCNCLWESMIFIPPSTWSSWWRWKILLSLWWLLFFCPWYILRPSVCVSFSNFIFSGGPGWNLWVQWVVNFLRWIIPESVRICIQFLRGGVHLFLADYNLVKNSNFQDPSTGREITPWTSAIQILAPEFQIEGRYYFSSYAHFGPRTYDEMF